MEQVRLEVAPSAPSRQKCMWLADTLVEAENWRTRLGGTGDILKLQLNGNIHRADASHLLADSQPLSETYARARSYWDGKPGEHPEFETLFCGSAKVIDVVSFP
jgi:hypothetical protein